MASFSPSDVQLYPQGAPSAWLGADAERAPALPTLSTTRLQLELLLSSRSVDLRATADLLLRDPGATLEIFRWAGEECGEALPRFEDCLAVLSTHSWMKAICAHQGERRHERPFSHARVASFWRHARETAEECRALAEGMRGLCPDQAYLVGLLHEAGDLPRLLGWDLRGTAGWDESRFPSSGARASLVGCWHLPPFLHDALDGVDSLHPWRELLDAAHGSAASAEALPAFALTPSHA